MITIEDLREVNSEYRCQETDFRIYPTDPDQITSRLQERIDALTITAADYKAGIGKAIYVYDRLIKLTAEIFRVFNNFQEVFYD